MSKMKRNLILTGKTFFDISLIWINYTKKNEGAFEQIIFFSRQIFCILKNGRIPIPSNKKILTCLRNSLFLADCNDVQIDLHKLVKKAREFNNENVITTEKLSAVLKTHRIFIVFLASPSNFIKISAVFAAHAFTCCFQKSNCTGELTV